MLSLQNDFVINNIFNDVVMRIFTEQTLKEYSIENEAQYKWAIEKVEELLPLVDDQTPLDDPNSIELQLLSNLVADYS